ncbi:nucleotide exchange factor GrpE [Rhodoblastus acidophilus]|uniref:Protein GrpE n=1 Tax=Candidatus Rhodoblastus alkanivorans TaxID=2954117 RepID=A0ABS9Z1Y0_9HYPH|nr:nucleotide exchange factor GrpE [Candidatus Rhodoblastus alkanivorans]MCI4678047.1 nucleotide exchange factor GrpE [Candidatus Rhodoblastus alkanivorans]MCI4681612.1 nucleotide exchange factor GrpE [Candidatus Rhodoblastus alkanivorans]MDI4642660.1 nucleotide exchange factor GrpE [Rhodoblastus acidophilus]
MNDGKNPQNEKLSPTDEAPAAETTPAQGDAERDAAAVQALIAENAGLKDRLLRTLAEMENLRRRTEKEVADAKAYGVTTFARDMLTFADNLRRALDNVPPEAREAADNTLKAFVEGIELTERDFLSRLSRHGVRKLEPKGQKFDPNFHEALFEAHDESVPPGTVAHVVEEGFAIGERVLRPAKVAVAKGGAKTN